MDLPTQIREEPEKCFRPSRERVWLPKEMMRISWPGLSAFDEPDRMCFYVKKR
jgi:hypothetical protein